MYTHQGASHRCIPTRGYLRVWIVHHRVYLRVWIVHHRVYLSGMVHTWVYLRVYYSPSRVYLRVCTTVGVPQGGDSAGYGPRSGRKKRSEG